jgi:hypothetical protein
MATLTMQELQNVRRAVSEIVALRHRVARLEALLALISDDGTTLTIKGRNFQVIDGNIASGRGHGVSSGDHNSV